MLLFLSLSGFAMAAVALIISFKADAHKKDAYVLMTHEANERAKLEAKVIMRIKLAKFLYNLSKDLIHNQKPHATTQTNLPTNRKTPPRDS